jgi:hypothetical protein
VNVKETNMKKTAILYDTAPVTTNRFGEDLDEIWWQGRQWAVTSYGIECRDGSYHIEADRLFENAQYGGWPAHMAHKVWVDIEDFCTAWLVAIAMHCPGFTLPNGVENKIAARELIQRALSAATVKETRMTMRAIKIDATARAVEEIDIPADPARGALDGLQAVVGGLIDRATVLKNGDSLFVNGEGLLNGTRDFFVIEGCPQPFPGNGVIIGHDGEEGSAPAKSSIAEIKRRVQFIDIGEVRRRVASGA